MVSNNNAIRASLLTLLLALSTQRTTSRQITKSDTVDTLPVCHELWAGPTYNNTGRVCLQLSNDKGELEIVYQTTEQWQIEENYMWLGDNLEEMIEDFGQPYFNDFPYIDRDIDGTTEYATSIFLQESDMLCKNGFSSLYLALHPVLVKTESNPNNVTETFDKTNTFLRASREEVKPESYLGVGWMEFDLHFSCERETAREPVTINNPSKVTYERRVFHPISTQRKLNDGCTGPSVSLSQSTEQRSPVLTEDFLYRFHVASTLAADVVYDRNLLKKIDYYNGMYERFDAFADGFNDAALVTKVQDVCYGIFRGTVEFNPFDDMQNLDPGFSKVPGTDCYVRRGFYNAYFTNYQQEFEQAVRGCVESCEGENCELVLSGGSQGASASIVAAIYLLEEYDPYVLSFGPMRTFLPTSPFNNKEVCTHYNEERMFHFVLTDSRIEVYDPVPYLFGFWAKNVGHEILYDGEGNFNYQGLARGYIMKRSPTSLTLHTRWNYVVKSKRAYANLCLPLPVFGWVNGHWCTDDDNCMTASYCQDGMCAPQLETGSACQTDGTCQSGSCIDGACSLEDASLSMNGARCNRHAECSSGRCKGFWRFAHCEEQLESGSSCKRHKDCISGHCAGIFDGECT